MMKTANATTGRATKTRTAEMNQMIDIPYQMTDIDWHKRGELLYGPDEMLWEFMCPNCDTVLSYMKFEKRKDVLKGWQPYAECIGRYLKDEGCDWAAYGLFSGPRELLNADGTHRAHVFYFAKEVESNG